MQRYQHVFYYRFAVSSIAQYGCGRLLPPHFKRLGLVVRRYAAFSEPPEPAGGIARTDDPATVDAPKSRAAFYFSAGYALFAKRPSRPFPPPFLSLPSHSFSEPLSTHHRALDKRREQRFEGELIRGITNGDDAVLVSENLIAANDGVGAWAQKERGHAAYVTSTLH